MNAQVNLPEKQSVVDFLEGQWELTSIQGLSGEFSFPDARDTFHYVFETGLTDSIMIMTQYHNHVWKLESEITIRAYDSSFGAWSISPFIGVSDRLALSLIDSRLSNSDSLSLVDRITDGPRWNLHPSQVDLSQYGQVPENFEFLDHSEKCTFNRGSKLLSDGIVYATNYYNKSWDFRGTAIKVARFDNTVDVLYDIKWDSDVNLQETSDTSFTYFLSNRFDHDVYWYGFHAVNFINEKMTDISTVDLEGYVMDIISDGPDTYWVTESQPSQNSLLRIQSGVITDTIDIDSSYHSLAYEPYMPLVIHGNNKVAYIENNNIEEIMDLDSMILDVHLDGYIYILTEGEVRVFFGFPPYSNFLSLPVSSEIKDFRGFDFDRIGYSFLDHTNDGIVIKRDIGFSGNYRSAELMIHEDETFLEFDVFRKETALISGEYGCQTFFRQINVDPDKSNNYVREDISADKFTIKGLPVDPMAELQDFEVSGEFTNNGVEHVWTTDAYSSNYNLGTIDITNYADFDLHTGYAPGESFSGSAEIKTIAGTDLSYMLLTLPGGNYRFNDSDMQIIPVDFTSSIETVASKEETLIFPNPSTGIVSILSDPQIAEVVVYNTEGRMVYFSKGKNLNADLDLSYVESGLYHIHIKDERGKLSYGKLNIVK